MVSAKLLGKKKGLKLLKKLHIKLKLRVHLKFSSLGSTSLKWWVAQVSSRGQWKTGSHDFLEHGKENNGLGPWGSRVWVCVEIL